STLVNRLLGEERVIASPIPGTTRDAIEIPLTRDGLDYVLVDTAGVRRRGKVDEAVEKFSVIKTLQAIERAHVVVVLIDAAEGVTDQDATVIGHVLDAGRALVLAANKWDGLAAHARERVKSELERKFVFVPWAEQVFISALHGSGLGELLKAVQRAHASASRVFSSSELTKAIEFAVEKVQPPMVRGRAAKLRYAHVGGNSPLRVIVHGSRLAALPDSYRRYLENFLRDRYELVGVPIRVEMRDGENPFAGRKNVLTEGQVRKRRRLIKHVKRR
ncbi:MAG: GTPase, partial [Lysobacterales bacterium]